MGTYKNIDHDLELSIRRGFSNDLNCFKEMKGWLDDAFKQMVGHRADMYSFNSRVKQIESLLRKLDGKRESDKTHDVVKWEKVKDYDELIAHVDDIIGGRLITYFVRDLPELMIYIANFERFCVKEITIHDMIENPVLYPSALRGLSLKNKEEDKISRSLRDDQLVAFEVFRNEFHSECTDEKIPYKIRLNPNGYVGIHIIIKPLPYDDYWKMEPGLFDKFELQIRSLIHEAWSEIQHKVIYKGKRMPDEVKLARASQFSMLSSILSSCEDQLYHAAHPQKRNDKA